MSDKVMPNELLQTQGQAQTQAQALGGSAAAPTDPSTPHPDMVTHHEALQSTFEATGKQLARLGQFEAALEPLLKKGENVTPEEVVESAGRLVASGEQPELLAAVLSDMPNGPGALAGWLRQHTQQLAQAKAQLAPVHEAVRHQLGVSSLHQLMGMSLNPQSQTPALNPQSTAPNLLTMTPQGTA